MVGDPAVEGERDPARMAARELDRQPAQLGGERDVRAEHLEILGTDDRDVDGVRDEAAVERGDDLLGDDQAGTILGLVGGRGEMRRHDDVLQPEQLTVVRLGREDVERRARDLAGANRRGQRRLVDELAAGGVDDPNAVSHPLQHVAADEAARLVGQRQMKRDEVGGLEDGLRRLRVVDAELAEAIGRDERVVADRRACRARARDAPPAGRSGRSPSTPSVLSASSIPPQRERSQRPSFSAA